jgi:hypothetical protein
MENDEENVWMRKYLIILTHFNATGFVKRREMSTIPLTACSINRYTRKNSEINYRYYMHAYDMITTVCFHCAMNFISSTLYKTAAAFIPSF